MSEERFSASDLEPGDEDKRALQRALVDRIAATVAVLAAGVSVGGMVALGACAAPAVFHFTPAPHSGTAMGIAFARWDQVALGAVVLILAAEVARTFAARGRARLVTARVRRLTAFAMAGCAAYLGLVITPHINELHQGGAQRGVDAAGLLLDAIHKRAELVGKIETALGVALIALHVFTLPLRRPEDDDQDYAEPLPPGPREG